ncbi:MAG: hypothetical protein R2793_09565 [Flavobacteriaceae bacterium]
MRQYKNLEMFIHAESMDAPAPCFLMDKWLLLFVWERFEYQFLRNSEIPLKAHDQNCPTQPMPMLICAPLEAD